MKLPIKKYTRRLIAVDADIVLYRAAWATEKESQMNAVASAYSILSDIADGCNSDNLVLCLSPKTNFRHAIYPEYKANRKDSAKPKHAEFLRNWLIEESGYSVAMPLNHEADDLMATYSDKYGAVIATIDKDLDQVAGDHYNFVRDELYIITEAKAKRLLYLQILTGDSTDNIKGLPWVGKAKAKKSLDAMGYTLRNVKYLYTDKGYDDRYFQVQFDLIRMHIVPDNEIVHLNNMEIDYE